MSHEERCARALGDFTDLLVDGRAPSIEAFLLQHPDLADDLRPLLETTVELHEDLEPIRRRLRLKKSKKKGKPR